MLNLLEFLFLSKFCALVIFNFKCFYLISVLVDSFNILYYNIRYPTNSRKIWLRNCEDLYFDKPFSLIRLYWTTTLIIKYKIRRHLIQIHHIHETLQYRFQLSAKFTTKQTLRVNTREVRGFFVSFALLEKKKIQQYNTYTDFNSAWRTLEWEYYANPEGVCSALYDLHLFPSQKWNENIRFMIFSSYLTNIINCWQYELDSLRNEKTN